MNKKILFVCTGNSCRSQMAEAFLRSLNKDLQVYSAGTYPEKKVNPNAVTVMSEIGIDISGQVPNDLNEFTDQSFDYVITLCDNAKEKCPVFTGTVKNRLHLSFVDPAEAKGSKEKILEEYREVRDDIRYALEQFYKKKLS